MFNVIQVESFTTSGIDHDLWFFVLPDDTFAETRSKEVIVAGRKELPARGDRLSIITGVARPFLIREQKVEVAFTCTIESVALCTTGNAGPDDERVEAHGARQVCLECR